VCIIQSASQFPATCRESLIAAARESPGGVFIFHGFPRLSSAKFSRAADSNANDKSNLPCPPAPETGAVLTPLSYPPTAPSPACPSRRHNIRAGARISRRFDLRAARNGAREMRPRAAESRGRGGWLERGRRALARDQTRPRQDSRALRDKNRVPRGAHGFLIRSLN